jgi:hypothetical protein
LDRCSLTNKGGVYAGTPVAHCDSGKVPYERLKDYPLPEATGRWKPIAHLELVDTSRTRSTPITGLPPRALSSIHPLAVCLAPRSRRVLGR